MWHLTNHRAKLPIFFRMAYICVSLSKYSKTYLDQTSTTFYEYENNPVPKLYWISILNRIRSHFNVVTYLSSVYLTDLQIYHTRFFCEPALVSTKGVR